MVPLARDEEGPMRTYSMDLRVRALRDSDAGMKAADVAAKYHVSGSWVRLLKQGRRETGEVAPRPQRYGPRPKLEPHLQRLADLIQAQPDRTLAELKEAGGRPHPVRPLAHEHVHRRAANHGPDGARRD
jgi:transposase